MRVAAEIWARNVMVDADLSAAQVAEILFRPIGRGAVQRVRFLVISPLNFERCIQVVLRGGFVRMDNRTLRNA